MDLMCYEILEQLPAGNVVGDVLALPTTVSASKLLKMMANVCLYQVCMLECMSVDN